jgi:CRP-like cAMP-binding protein/Fe-S-cluster-containing hydrogenase component 2
MDLNEPQFRELLIDSDLHIKSKGDIVFERNDYTDSFFSIVGGFVEVLLPSGAVLPIRTGQFFGEMGLISGRRRTATVRAGSDCLLMETPRKQILKLMSSVVGVKRFLDEVFMLRALETNIFPDADRAFLVELTQKATLRNFKKGEKFFSEGDIGDALYVIRKGSAKISRKDRAGRDVCFTYVSAGNFVGEMALISAADVARSATVSAAVGCETIVLQKADFQELLSKSPKVKERINLLIQERRVENVTDDTEHSEGAVLDFIFQEGLSDASNVLVIDSDLCIACDNCESACAGTHNGYSRLDRKGGKFFAAVQVPISCRHCENPLCMTDCPPDALTRLPDGEVVIRDNCIGCGNCITNCPYGVIQLVYDKANASAGFSLLSMLGLKKKEKGPAKAAKCDMCSELSGGPACVRACPTGAAIRVNPSELVQLMQRKGGMV